MAVGRWTGRTARLWTAAVAFVGAVTVAAAAQAAVATVTMFSASNNRQLKFQVYTPPGYAPGGSLRYPTVYSLHGEGGTSLQRSSTYAPTLDAAISGGQLSPMIWVFPDGQDDSFYGDAFDGTRRVYSKIIGEVLPFVDAHYKTIADREHRAVEGFSMGGFGAALYAAKDPELFSAVVEYAGALATWDDMVRFEGDVVREMYNGVEANWLPYSAWDVTTNNAAAVSALVDYKMIVGDADPQYASNVRFRDHLLSLGIDPHFEVLPGVGHVGGLYLKEGSGLEFLEQHFAAPPATTGDFNDDLEVDGADFLMWQRQLGRMGAPRADGNDDGIVDAVDLALWRGEYGESSAASAPLVAAGVPEPPARVLAALAAALGIAAGLWARMRNMISPVGYRRLVGD